MFKDKYCPLLILVFLLGTFLVGCLPNNIKRGSIAGTIVIREELTSDSNNLKAISSNTSLPLGYKPLKGALIKVKNTNISTFSNASGAFLLNNLPEGLQTLVVTAPFSNISREFEVEVLPNAINTVFYPVGKGYYLIIGVSLYAKIPSLYSADANAMEEFFVKTPGTVITVRDQDATRDNILNIFNRLKKELQPEDYLVVYFSGHGAYDHLLLYNYSKEDPYDSLSDLDLKEHFLQMPTKEITLVMDSCFSGSLFDGKPAVRQPTPKALQNSGYVLLASSLASQVSYQYSNDGGLGLFTKHFLLGLINRGADTNSDGKITAQEIFVYIQKTFAYLNLPEDNLQTPIFEDTLNINPVLYRYIP